MIRHWTFASDSPRRRSTWWSRHPQLVFAIRVLVREAAIGAALYARAGAARALNLRVGLFILLLALLWILVILWSRWFGLMRPLCWPRSVTEASLLYIGSVCGTNVLLIALQSPLWAARL